MEEFNKGLFVTLFGMGLVFLSLTLIMFAIWGLERLFRQEAKEEAPVVAIVDEALSEEDEVAATIGVALAVAMEEQAQRESRKLVGVASAAGEASAWATMGRQLLMNSRYFVRETKRQ